MRNARLWLIPPLLACGVAVSARSGETRPYQLPTERSITLAPGVDSDLADAYCSGCHSLDYIETQPRGKGAAFWKGAVTKMVRVYAAPIEPEAAERIMLYLARTY